VVNRLMSRGCNPQVPGAGPGAREMHSEWIGSVVHNLWDLWVGLMVDMF